MIKILIADDHTIMRDGLKRILAGCEDMLVAGEADNGADVLKEIRQQDWDVVILDMFMPGKSGIELIKQIKAEKPGLPILVLSMHKEKQYAGHTWRAGASGYICKDSATAQLVSAIRKVASGGVYISPEAAENLVLGMSTRSDALPHTLLSDREHQIFMLLVTGKGVTEIANTLNISVKTVSTHKANIMQKMDMQNTASLVRYALNNKLIDAGGEPST